MAYIFVNGIRLMMAVAMKKWERLVVMMAMFPGIVSCSSSPTFRTYVPGVSSGAYVELELRDVGWKTPTQQIDVTYCSSQGLFSGDNSQQLGFYTIRAHEPFFHDLHLAAEWQGSQRVLIRNTCQDRRPFDAPPLVIDVGALQLEGDIDHNNYVKLKPSSQPPPPQEAFPEGPSLPLEDKAYTYVEEMPVFSGERGAERVPANYVTLGRAIGRRLVLPQAAKKGVVLLHLVVDKAGDVRHLRIKEGLGAATDSAVLAAARQLPRLVPGKQREQPVSVEFTVPVSID
ncbi:hypothetical protein DNI29_22165 [Hymenobacter sediminis]|uniref:energy transducer TonB n=1 Tax=Hymenobacter sediminis TaxID=2218621 RepID=UPI000DA6651D|nr:energy transducer TonB [Hymenobacter sediminis]RPD44105.1 hypothetical protein DNI29_22165 [Hymenobacter sediminis]